jgi:choline dehydrogenase-like flavoprotein
MNVSYVPWALALGARVYASCRVERVELRGGRAVGVSARTTSTEPGRATSQRVLLRARRGVIVAASTIQTPNILYRSGVRGRALGQHFQVHPGVGLGALFDQPIHMAFGATQGAESIAFRKTDRFKLETISMQPELAAVRIPGAGPELVERMGSLEHLAIFAVQVRARSEGTVKPGWGGADRVSLTLGEEDVAAGRKGLALLARQLFEAGAREVWPGIFGVPSVLRRPDEVRLIEAVTPDPRSFSFIATHLFGAARMGPDPRTSVIAPSFEAHAARGLYVVDSSIFPTNLGVNPQHTIMALSRLAATRIADSARSAAA